MKKRVLMSALLAVAAGASHAAVINVGDATSGAQAADLLTVDTHWTADNTYVLQDQIWVMPGATLTIDAGVVVQSTPVLQGSLAVTRGADIFVNGTQTDPVIFTSSADIATWDVDGAHPTGKNPQTGTARLGANEWGNLTIMGAAIVSENAVAGNTATPAATNVANMEGLTVPAGQPTMIVQYGGGDDDDDSGSISYVSIRYGGKVVGLANELNGLSLGGIGRGTDIHHVEIFNNVDDGIEIWGGTVNLKYVNIWNVGDDSFDVDQGWRGKAQHGLIVQGASADAAQGSGFGDNIFEMDGAERAAYQPVTTAAIYNFTAIGQPYGSNSADHATAWRDNARVQFRNCIFMDIGDNVVHNDGDGGEGLGSYGENGTLDFATTFATDAGTHPTINQSTTAPFRGQDMYLAQSVEFNGNTSGPNSGKLAEIKDSVFYNNTNSAYGDTDTVGVTIAGDDNAAKGNVVASASPIVGLTRDAAPLNIINGTLVYEPVLQINPFPANDALTSLDTAPNDGFFDQAAYRGGFEPQSAKGVSDSNWLLGWTAIDAFDMIDPAADGPPPSSVEAWIAY